MYYSHNYADYADQAFWVSTARLAALSSWIAASKKTWHHNKLKGSLGEIHHKATYSSYVRS